MKTVYEINRTYLRTRHVQALLLSLEHNGEGVARSAAAARAPLVSMEDPTIADIHDMKTLMQALQGGYEHIGRVLGELRERIAEQKV